MTLDGLRDFFSHDATIEWTALELRRHVLKGAILTSDEFILIRVHTHLNFALTTRIGALFGVFVLVLKLNCLFSLILVCIDIWYSPATLA